MPRRESSIAEDRLPHIAAALCQGRLGQLIIANGRPDPYYSGDFNDDAQREIRFMNEWTQRDISLAVQGMTVKGAIDSTIDERKATGDTRKPQSVNSQRRRVGEKLGAQTAPHLVRTAIEYGAVPFESVDLSDPPSMHVKSLLVVGLSSHGLWLPHIGKTIDGNTNQFGDRAADVVLQGAKGKEEGFARMAKMVYVGFSDGWFQPEAGGVLHPGAVQNGVRQMLDPKATFTPIGPKLAV